MVFAGVHRRLGYSQEQLLRQDRSRSAVYARNIAMYVLHSELRLSSPEIGRLLSRDHSTVLHGIHTVRDALANGDSLMRADVAAVLQAP